jgi:hypothetical protein
MPRQRRFHVLMAAAAIAAGAMQVLAGSAELALTFAPLLLIAGLLLSGRYLGEERILARRLRGAAVVSRRRISARWRPSVERPLVSLLARSPRSERGPPALAPALAA